MRLLNVRKICPTGVKLTACRSCAARNAKICLHGYGSDQLRNLNGVLSRATSCILSQYETPRDDRSDVPYSATSRNIEDMPRSLLTAHRTAYRHLRLEIPDVILLFHVSLNAKSEACRSHDLARGCLSVVIWIASAVLS